MSCIRLLNNFSNFDNQIPVLRIGCFLLGLVLYFRKEINLLYVSFKILKENSQFLLGISQPLCHMTEVAVVLVCQIRPVHQIHRHRLLEHCWGPVGTEAGHPTERTSHRL